MQICRLDKFVMFDKFVGSCFRLCKSACFVSNSSSTTGLHVVLDIVLDIFVNNSTYIILQF
ncbi:hypothetical protein Hdeb2414_s0039g00735531 [Helianthus debilis subsp. tardiflorus]